MKKSFYKYFWVLLSILIAFFVINHLYGRTILYQGIHFKNNQSVDLEVLNANKNVEGAPINLFYSNFTLPTKEKPKFKTWQGVSVAYFDEIELQMINPLKTDAIVIDNIFLEKNIPNLTNGFTNELLLPELDSNSLFDELILKCSYNFDWCLHCLKLKPKTLVEFYLLTKTRLDEYIFEILFKDIVFMRFNIAILEMKDINSILKYYKKKENRHLEAWIWSKNGKIHTNFILKSNSIEKSKKMMIDILSTFKFNLDELPDKETINKKPSEAIHVYEFNEP